MSILKTSVIVVAVMSSQSVLAGKAEEWQINRLLHPSFKELEAEAVFGQVTTYCNIDDKTISRVKEKFPNRIKYMDFSKKDEGDCQ